MSRWLSLLLLPLAACGHLQLGVIGSEAPTPLVGWRELRTAHFVIDTDEPKGLEESVVASLEYAHALLVQALVGKQMEFPGRVRAIVVNDQYLFYELRGRVVADGYFGTSLFGEPMIVLNAAGTLRLPELVAHEMTHRVTSFLYPRQPAWFSEGVAHFNETVARGDALHWAGVKIQPNLALALWQQGGRVPSAELMAWKGEEEPGRPSRYHLSGWLLYHYLWDTKLQALGAFEARLAKAEDPASAWAATFPEYDPARIAGAARLDAELDAYLRGGIFGSYMVEAPFDSRFSSTPLASSEARALLLDAQYSRRKPENGPTDLAISEAILREDPTQPLATYAKAGMQNLPVLESLRRSVETHPHDWRAWFLLAHALGSGDVEEREAAYRKSLELNPDCPQTNNDLAWFLYEQRRPKEAEPFAGRAVALSPSRPTYLHTLAAIADAQGRCLDALHLEERAAGAAPTATAILRPLGALRAKCGAPPASAQETWKEFPSPAGL